MQKINPHTSKQKPSSKEIKPPKKISERYLRNSGLYYLQRFVTSSGHFRVVMTRKIDKSCRHHKDQSRDECLQMLEIVVQEFLDQGMIDDKGYTLGMVRSLRRRGISARGIQAKLRQKRIGGDMIKSAIDEVNRDNENSVPSFEETGEDVNHDFNAALILARRKKIGIFSKYRHELAAMAHEDKQPLERKWIGAMARAGFSYDVCRRILDISEDELNDHGIFLPSL
jgi:regulatory protein